MHVYDLKDDLNELIEGLASEEAVQKDLQDCLKYGLLICDIADIYSELSGKFKDNVITADEFGRTLDENLHKLEKIYRDLF